MKARIALLTECRDRSSLLGRSPIATLFAGIWLLGSGAGHGAQPLTLPFQLTHSQNMDARPSPDGKQLVYISVILGREQLVTVHTDGSTPNQITHDGADYEDPSWSPDGSSIAAVRISEDQERIYLMGADGTAMRAVSPAGVRAIHPEWSADGKRLIYCTDDDLHPPAKNPADIDTIELASGQVSTLVSGGINTYPQWSPDMRHLVFRRIIGERNSEVFLADADGRNQSNLTNNPAFDGWPSWSPDGKSIAFASDRNGAGYQIFVMSADGSGVRLVANTAGRATAPRWSPDGRLIYFTNCVPRDYSSDCQVWVSRIEN